MLDAGVDMDNCHKGSESEGGPAASPKPSSLDNPSTVRSRPEQGHGLESELADAQRAIDMVIMFVDRRHQGFLREEDLANLKINASYSKRLPRSSLKSEHRLFF